MAEISTTNCFICDEVPVPAPPAEPEFISGGPTLRAKNLFILLQRILELPDLDLAEDQSEIVNQISFCKSCLDELEVTKDMLEAFEKVKKMADRHKSQIQSKFLESKVQGSHSKSNKNLEIGGIGGVTELRSQMVAELKSRSGSASTLMTISSKTPRVIKNVTCTTKPNLPKDSAGVMRNVPSELNGADDALNTSKELSNSDDLDSDQRPSAPLPVPITKASRSGVGQKKQVSNDSSKANQQTGQGEKKLPTRPCTPPNISSTVLRVTPTKSNERKHKCHMCPAKFNRMGNIIQHLRIHTGEQPLTGSDQEPSTPLPSTKANRSGLGKNKEVTNDPRNSNEQMRQVKKKLPTSPCAPQNNRSISFKPQAVPKKTRLNSNGKKHKCQSCPARFNYKSYLARHLRIHTGVKPYSCKLCLKTFSKMSHLKEHQLVHSGEKQFRCKICLKTFSQSGNLVTHMRTHTREKPYPCKICLKSFTQYSTLVTHMRTHTGEKPFKCTVCSKEFTQLSHLNVHRKTQHLHD